ncbi:MAG TPA: helix-turn-helix domain-containing protein [Candidatus Paceibacterota bacterium]|nr:helix-turn-helix domain-containing protein [Candidatus Paceibacterota bacterium]
MRKVRHTCPVGKAAALVGDHCSLLIIRDLLESPRRFGELETSLGSSTRTLTKKLKMLEHEKIVTRKEAGDGPSCIKYQLTRKGEALEPTIDAMRTFGSKYLR